jgi:hypothetical protein
VRPNACNSLPEQMCLPGPGCVKTRRGITAPGILRLVVMPGAKKRKNSSSARCYDQIRFRFHTAWVKNRPAASHSYVSFRQGRTLPMREERGPRRPQYPHRPHARRISRGYTSHICALLRQGLHVDTLMGERRTPTQQQAGASPRRVHCVLLGSLLTTVAVQLGRCRRFIGKLLACIKYAPRTLEDEERRRESLTPREAWENSNA